MIGQVASSRLKLKYIHRAISFSAVDCGNVCSFERTDSFSIAMWSRFAQSGFSFPIAKSSAPRGYIIQKGSTSAGSLGLMLTSNYPSDYIEKHTTTDWNDNNWHHFVATYDGSSTAAGIDLYVDGVAQTTTTPAAPGLTGTIVVTQSLGLGCRFEPTPAFDFVGDLMDCGIYNKKLSSGEVATIYKKGSPVNLATQGPFANLVGFWRPLLTDIVPTITDSSTGGHNGTGVGDLASVQSLLVPR